MALSFPRWRLRHNTGFLAGVVDMARLAVGLAWSPMTLSRGGQPKARGRLMWVEPTWDGGTRAMSGNFLWPTYRDIVAHRLELGLF
jgi:hypothetical protein